jgi:hypothetical protein
MDHLNGSPQWITSTAHVDRATPQKRNAAIAAIVLPSRGHAAPQIRPHSWFMNIP